MAHCYGPELQVNIYCTQNEKSRLKPTKTNFTTTNEKGHEVYCCIPSSVSKVENKLVNDWESGFFLDFKESHCHYWHTKVAVDIGLRKVNHPCEGKSPVKMKSKRFSKRGHRGVESEAPLFRIPPTLPPLLYISLHTKMPGWWFMVCCADHLPNSRTKSFRLLFF